MTYHCEDWPCCGHEFGDCDGSLYGSDTDVQTDPHLYCDHNSGFCDVWESYQLDQEESDDPHCFVCHRHTDHWGEHDALVEAGLAEYHQDGTVTRTYLWSDDLAKQIVCAEQNEFAKYLTGENNE